MSMEKINQNGFAMPLVVLIGGLVLAVVLYYLYFSGTGTSLQQMNPSDENINVAPQEVPGVNYTTE